MRTQDVLRHELIGKNIEVVGASNPELIGITGKVVDETRNMLELDNGKKLVKEQITLKMNIGKETVIMEGKHLVGRPEDRLKKVKE